MNEEKNSRKTTDKSLLRMVGEGSIIFTAANFILKLLAVVSTFILLRELAVYDYGIWRLLLSAIAFVTVITLPSIENLLVADISREIGKNGKGGHRRIMFESTVLFSVLGAISFAVMFLGAPVISAVTKIDLTLYLQILSFSFLLIPLKRMYTIAFHSQMQFLHLQGVKIVSKAGYIFSLFLLVWWYDFGLMGVVYAYVVSIILPTLLYFPAFIRSRRFQDTEEPVSKHILWDVLKSHGKWALLMNYFDNVRASVSPWIMGYFIGIENMALVMVTFTMFDEIASAFPMDQILAPIMPRYVDDKERFRTLYVRSIKYGLWFYVLVSVVALLAAITLVPVLFPQYASSVPYFAVTLVSIIAVPFGVVTTRVFYSLKEQRGLFESTVIPRGFGTVIVLPLCLFFFGIWGAVAEYIITGFGVSVMRIMKIEKSSPELRFLWRSLLSFDTEDGLLLRRVWGSVRAKTIG